MGSEPKQMKAIIKDPQHLKRVADTVQMFYIKQDYMDLCFVCARGHRVFAHKLLLCAVSTQMRKMFMELPDNIDLITIHLPDVEARMLRLMFDFLYQGSLKLDGSDYKEFNNLKELLGIVLHRSTPCGTTKQHQSEPPTTSQAQQPIQPQAVFYMQAPGPNSQGQMQYVVAAPSTLSQGQMMQMTQAAAQGQLMQVSQTTASGQVMQVSQNPAPGQMMQVSQNPAPGQMMQVSQNTAPGQMMQVSQNTAPGQMMQVSQNTATGQVIQMAQAQSSNHVVQVAAPNTSIHQGQLMQMAPAIMTQANGHMVQGGSQIVSTTMHQNNMVHVVPQNNSQVVPMVAGSQMVQCSSQMVVQAGQPTMINNQIQNHQNQVPQPTQRPQYVMSSTANQMTTNRGRAQYTQPQTTPQQRVVARSRATAQVTTQPIRNNTVNNVAGSSTMQDILAILQENCSNLETIETLTARQLREILEPKLGVDLSNQEDLIERVLNSFRGVSSESKSEGDSAARVTKSSVRGRAVGPAPATGRATRRRKKIVSLSDDEDDEDFDPRKQVRKARKK